MHLALAAALPIFAFLALTWRRADRRVALLFALVAAAYALPYLLLQGTPVSVDFLYREAPWTAGTPAGHRQKNPLINDVPLQMLPWQEAARAAWLGGELPFLDRATGSGAPLWENPQAAVLYPSSLAGILTTTFGWPLLSLVSKLLLAQWGMFLLLGRARLSAPSRVFGAFAYAFSTFAIAFALFPHTNVTSLLPLLLATLHEVTKSWRGTAGATAVVIAMLLGGHPETVMHAAFIAIPYAVAISWRERTAWRRLTPRFAAVGIIGALIALPLLLPFVASIRHTQRYFEVHGQPSSHATPPPTLENLVVIAIPNYFGNPRVHNYRHDFNYNELCTQYAGLLTLALAFGAAVAAPRRHRFWIVTAVLSLLLAFQPPALTRLIAEIPVIGLAPHGRMRVILTLALAILGAHGLELLLRGEKRRILAGSATALTLIVVAICAVSYPTFAAFGIRRLIFFTELPALAATAAAAITALFAVKQPRWLLPGLLLADLMVTSLFYNPPNGREHYYPSTPAIAAMQQVGGPGRVVGIERALLPITARFYGLEDIRVHDPVAFRPYVAVLDAAGWDRTDYFGRFPTLPPQTLLDFLGVRFVLTEPGVALALPIAYRGNDASVYRNETALDRFFVPEQVVRHDDPTIAFVAGRTAREIYTRDRAISPAKATIRLERYDNNGSSLRVRSTGESFVASSEVALPGWSLTRNGETWPMIRINGAFLGWEVPEGDSLFRLSYRPPFLLASAFASVCGLILLALMLRNRDARPSRADPV